MKKKRNDDSFPKHKYFFSKPAKRGWHGTLNFLAH